MKHIKLKIDEETYQLLNKMFKDDEKLICEFAVKALKSEILKTCSDEIKPNPDKNINELKNYLKAGKTGSRSYGTKGQGW